MTAGDGPCEDSADAETAFALAGSDLLEDRLRSCNTCLRLRDCQEGYAPDEVCICLGWVHFRAHNA